MKVYHTKAEVREAVAELRRGGASLGLVPTMGALHEGHLSLIRRSVAESGATVVSLFVNPAQFAPGEDFEKYPRTLETDLEACREAGTDVVFAPSAGEMYPEDFSTYVEETKLSRHLCGASRPGHFRGVTTVCAKLFNVVRPDRAYFGQKDAQQAAIIRRMVRDLDMPLEIVVCPVVREEDGLAVSSRNSYLDPDERREAVVLSEALGRARGLFAAGERDADKLKKAMAETIRSAERARIDYVEVADAESLEPVERVEAPALAAVAVRFGDTRLIDNCLLEP